MSVVCDAVLYIALIARIRSGLCSALVAYMHLTSVLLVRTLLTYCPHDEWCALFTIPRCAYAGLQYQCYHTYTTIARCIAAGHRWTQSPSFRGRSSVLQYSVPKLHNINATIHHTVSTNRSVKVMNSVKVRCNTDIHAGDRDE
ncbi:hypothetical protein GY45DRAFT_1166057 [Cubamyces sp. BRFM 1775]|nr:hypothetical protein GY45DRAFT_1166057 [Cubamyces sp. BRFM 1775]